MTPRRTLAVLISLSALTVSGLPLAAASAAPLDRPAAVSAARVAATEAYYTVRSGGVRLVLAPAFMRQLRASGATLEAIEPAVLGRDRRTGATTVTMAAIPDTAAVAFTAENSRTVYFFTEGGIRISGNGTSIDLTDNLFAFDNVTSIDFTPNGLDPVDGYAVGPLMRMPSKATRGVVSFTSPRFVVQEPLRDMLRGEADPETGRPAGPVPAMTTRNVPLGFAQVALRVTPIR